MSNFALAPESAARYRAITHHSLHVVHNRQRCACGKQVTAKHMTQFGRCPTCQNAATKFDPKVLVHFTGAADNPQDNRRWWPCGDLAEKVSAT